jgi:hypothetical protein
VSKPPQHEPGVSYAADPTAEFAEARALEAAASLGRVLGVGAGEARAMLEDGRAVTELRALAEMRCPLCPPLSPLRAYRRLLGKLLCP